MKKIPSLFKRDFAGDPRVVTEDYNDAVEWVVNGEGVPTVKRDGTCIRIDFHDLNNPLISKRIDVKKGKTPPVGFQASGEPDPTTGNCQGWIEVDPNDPANKYIVEAYNNYGELPSTGTYEVCGPKIGTRAGANPEYLGKHVMFKHGAQVLHDVPTDYEGLQRYLWFNVIEGIVWHHRDGRMCKIKRSDFGFAWPLKK